MFGNKPTTNANSNIELDQKKDFSIDVKNLPIHTMKKDLTNPSDSSLSQTPPPASLPKAIQDKPVNDKQKTSPFLSPASTNAAQPAAAPQPKQPVLPKPEPLSQPKKEPIDYQPPVPAREVRPTQQPPKSDIYITPEQKPQDPSITVYADTPAPKPAWHKVIAIAIIVFSILLLFSGGYYFWITRPSDTLPGDEPMITEPTPKPEEKVTPPPKPEEKITFALDKPNYLNLDIDTITSSQIKDKLTSYGQEVVKSGAPTAVEFIIVDPKNSPVPFSVFAQKAGLKLSTNVFANLSDTFSLFIYNDNKKWRLGLWIEAKDSAQLKKFLQQDESTLVDALKPLLINSPEASATHTFNSSTYNGAEIRYQNLISPEELSVDYTVYSNHLFIGTTKMTLRTMLDSEAVDNL